MRSLLYDASLRLSWALLLFSTAACAQSSAPAANSENPPELAGKIERLTKSLEQTQVELAESRTEIQQLRATLQEVLKRIDVLAATPAGPTVQEDATAAASQTGAQQAMPEEARAAAQISQDDWDVLNARVEEQRQTKVESASKYRVKLSGLALFNAFANFGQVDSIDLPGIAVSNGLGYSDGSVGASVRQSIIGLTGIGPVVFGARTLADFQMDFF